MRGGKSAGRPFLVMSPVRTPQKMSESPGLGCCLMLASVYRIQYVDCMKEYR